MTQIIPTTEIKLSNTVQVNKVSLTVKSKYSLNIQKPASFTCEAANDPAPIAKTIKAGFTPAEVISGKTNPAAVNDATVAEPNATLKTTVIS